MCHWPRLSIALRQSLLCSVKSSFASVFGASWKGMWICRAKQNWDMCKVLEGHDEHQNSWAVPLLTLYFIIIFFLSLLLFCGGITYLFHLLPAENGFTLCQVHLWNNLLTAALSVPRIMFLKQKVAKYSKRSKAASHLLTAAETWRKHEDWKKAIKIGEVESLLFCY